MSANPLDGWTVPRDEIEFVGRDLQRPECVLAEPDGTLWSADARGSVMRIGPDGDQQLIAQEVVEPSGDAGSVARYVLEGTLPNGLAFDREGNFVIANFGTDAVERMTREGESTTLYTEIEGRPIGKANFVLADSRGRIWLTVHTRLDPWTLGQREDAGRLHRAADDGQRHVRRARPAHRLPWQADGPDPAVVSLPRPRPANGPLAPAYER